MHRSMCPVVVIVVCECGFGEKTNPTADNKTTEGGFEGVLEGGLTRMGRALKKT